MCHEEVNKYQYNNCVWEENEDSYTICEMFKQGEILKHLCSLSLYKIFKGKRMLWWIFELWWWKKIWGFRMGWLGDNSLVDLHALGMADISNLIEGLLLHNVIHYYQVDPETCNWK